MVVAVAVVVAVVTEGKESDVVGALVVDMEAASGMTSVNAGEKTGDALPWIKPSW